MWHFTNVFPDVFIFRSSAIPSNTVAVSSSIYFSGSSLFSKICSNVDLDVFPSSPIIPHNDHGNDPIGYSNTSLSLFHGVASVVLVAQTYCCVILFE